ncbi:MAG: hypothetical protein DBX55_10110 [Verrucomicrobia bacterium]|nr:MAG: hypothetical protein DBX55_10110 [Verrucomicrobiota bacterium]
MIGKFYFLDWHMFKLTRNLSIACGLMAVCAQALCAAGSAMAAADARSAESAAKICAQALRNFAVKALKTHSHTAANTGTRPAGGLPTSGGLPTLVSQCPRDILSGFSGSEDILLSPFACADFSDARACALRTARISLHSGSSNRSAAALERALPPIRGPTDGVQS